MNDERVKRLREEWMEKCRKKGYHPLDELHRKVTFEDVEIIYLCRWCGMSVKVTGEWEDKGF